jgi:hypothetical protein
MVETQTITFILGTLVLLVTALGTYYSNGLRLALQGSDLAEVWKYMGIGVFLLFIGAIVGGGLKLLEREALNSVLLTLWIGSIFLTYGLKLQLDKVK